MGRKPGIPRAEQLFRDEIARGLSLAIGAERGAQSRAADQLGISRQAFSLYMNRRATPSSAILGRICAKWPQLSFNIDNFRMNASCFNIQQPTSRSPIQMSLFDAISEVENKQLDVKVLKKGVNSIELKVSIDFKHA